LEISLNEILFYYYYREKGQCQQKILSRNFYRFNKNTVLNIFLLLENKIHVKIKNFLQFVFSLVLMNR